MFYFEQLLQTALNGIDAANVTGTVLGLAATMLLLSFLYSAYQAFASGGDVRMLAVSGIKYLFLGIVFAHYGTVFRDVNRMFNSVADFVYTSTGVGDLFANWMNQLSQYWQTNGSASLWNLVTGLASGVISLWLILGAFVIFPVCYLIFTIFYAMYGSVLYLTGPFVLALLPARGLGQLSRTYLINLMTFQAWGLIYALMQVLMSAVNLSSISAVLEAHGVLNSFVGSSEMILLALTASIFSFSLALIPYMASRIVRGDVGSTMLTMVGTMAAAASALAGVAAASFVGVHEGAAASQSAAGAASGLAGSGGMPVAYASTPPTPPSIDGTRAEMQIGSGNTALEAAHSDTPSSPPSPQGASSRPGQYRRVSISHALAWYVGHSLGSAYQGVRGKR